MSDINPYVGAINPDLYYSDRDLRSWQRIMMADQARQAGRLRGVWVGSEWQFRGSDIIAWLDAGAPVTPEGKAAAPAAVPQRQVPRRSVPATVAEAPNRLRSEDSMKRDWTGSPTEEFTRRVNGLVAEGKTRAEAVRSVVHADPHLHQLLLVEANQNRPGTMKGIARMR